MHPIKNWHFLSDCKVDKYVKSVNIVNAVQFAKISIQDMVSSPPPDPPPKKKDVRKKIVSTGGDTSIKVTPLTLI